MTMTTSQETITEATRRSQEAIASAAQIWAEGVHKFVGLMPTPDAKVPSVDFRLIEEVVDNAFDFAEQALATQREFTKSLLAATKSVASNAAWVAQSAVKNKS
jgi:hypothetical protein